MPEALQPSQLRSKLGSRVPSAATSPRQVKPHLTSRGEGGGRPQKSLLDQTLRHRSTSPRLVSAAALLLHPRTHRVLRPTEEGGGACGARAPCYNHVLRVVSLGFTTREDRQTRHDLQAAVMCARLKNTEPPWTPTLSSLKKHDHRRPREMSITAPLSAPRPPTHTQPGRLCCCTAKIQQAGLLPSTAGRGPCAARRTWRPPSGAPRRAPDLSG